MTTNYMLDIIVSVQAETVLNAITIDIDKWWAPISGKALFEGDIFVVGFGIQTFKKIRIE